MANSDVMCSFTRPKGTSLGEAVITHEVCITFRASETHRSKNEKQSIGLLSFLVAGVRFFIARPSRIVEMCAKLSFASFLLAWWGIASRKRHAVAFSLAHPRPPPEVFESKANPQPKRQGSPLDCLAFLVAGVGFFIARPSRIVEMHAKHSFAPFLLALWGIASRKRHAVAFSLAHPRPPPEVFESKANPQPKRQGSPLDCLAFLVAGVGFFIARPSRIVEMCAKLSFASFLLAWWGIASRKRRTVAFRLLTHDLLRRSSKAKPTHNQKGKAVRWTALPFWLRGWDLNLTTSGL